MSYLAIRPTSPTRAWSRAVIGSHSDDRLTDAEMNSLNQLNNSDSPAGYSQQLRPGGTWEAVQWWLDPDRIPTEMRWVCNYQLANGVQKVERRSRLLLV